MAMPYIDEPLKDGFTPCGVPVFSSPIRASTQSYVCSVPFMGLLKNYHVEGLDAPGPSGLQNSGQFRLVAEGPLQDMGGGVVKVIRTYARTPTMHNEFESYSYSFIGFVGAWTVGNQGSNVTATGRPRISRVVTSRVQHDYFHQPGGDASPIEILKGLHYYGGQTPGPSTALEVDYLSDAFGGVPATVPSLTDYKNLITSKSEIIVEDSRITRWMGNIFLRQTRYIKAE